MRPIKFRGFRNFKGNALYPPDKRWIYGYYYFNAGKHWIKNKADMAQTFIVEEDSVGEYAGLKDKNGKEIYEGDILKTQYNNIGLVKHSLSICWYLEYKHQSDRSKKTIQLWNILHDLEIIGNVEENPELLE